MTFPWPQYESRLLDMYDKGATFTEIADALSAATGITTSRKAVAGRLHRLGLKRRRGSPNYRVTKKRPTPSTPKPAPKIERQPTAAFILASGAPFMRQKTEALPTLRKPSLPLPESKPRSLMNLPNNSCHWPLDEEEKGIAGRWMLCGAKRSTRLWGSGRKPVCPYCDSHADRAVSVKREAA